MKNLLFRLWASQTPSVSNNSFAFNDHLPSLIARCFDSNADNEEVYGESTKEIILSSLNGINGTIFMYGQTGAGKTYTMLGDYSTEILKPTAGQLKNHMKKSMINAAERKSALNLTADSSDLRVDGVKKNVRE